MKYPADRYPLWNDWRWQMQNRVRDAASLARWIPLSDAEREEIENCTVRFRMAVTPYFLSLIDPADPDDPIRRQCIVSSKELIRSEVEKSDHLSSRPCSAGCTAGTARGAALSGKAT